MSRGVSVLIGGRTVYGICPWLWYCVCTMIIQKCTEQKNPEGFLLWKLSVSLSYQQHRHNKSTEFVDRVWWSLLIVKPETAGRITYCADQYIYIKNGSKDHVYVERDIHIPNFSCMVQPGLTFLVFFWQKLWIIPRNFLVSAQLRFYGEPLLIRVIIIITLLV